MKYNSIAGNANLRSLRCCCLGGLFDMWIFKENRAFTLMELIVAIIIVGVLASLAIPRFSDTIEKSRTAEAINILQTLREAQEVYRLENPGYTADPTDLDVTIPASQNFNAPTLATADPVASIERNAGGYQYTLTIDADGTVSCGGTENPANICAKLGCPGGTCN